MKAIVSYGAFEGNPPCMLELEVSSVEEAIIQAFEMEPVGGAEQLSLEELIEEAEWRNQNGSPYTMIGMFDGNEFVQII